jgi:hypothetical protein
MPAKASVHARKGRSVCVPVPSTPESHERRSGAGSSHVHVSRLSGMRQPHTRVVTFYGDLVARVGQRWNKRRTHRSLAPTGPQRLSPSRIRQLVVRGIVTDVLLVALLVVALLLDWAVMTKLLLVGLGIGALSWYLLWLNVKKNSQL